MKQKILVLGLMILSLTACMIKPTKYDYSAFNKSKPRSILVVMPRNETNEIGASVGVLSKITYPLAEAGYYVFPVVVADALFKQNGLTNGDEILHVNLSKLHAIFNADAVLYINILSYGSSFQLLQSDTRVTLSAILIDAKTGDTIWTGTSTASSLEQRQNNSDIYTSLVIAIFDQISNTINDKSLDIADLAAKRLLNVSPQKYNGILTGPRYIQQ